MARRKRWRIALIVAVLAVPAALALLPRFRYSRDILLAELALGAGLLAWWAFRGHRRAERLGWGARLVTGVLGLCFLGSLVAGADTAAGAFDYYWYHRISDQGPYESPCGPFGLDTTRLDTRALAAVRTAFPGAQVKIIRGCRLLEDGPDRT